MLQFVGTFWLTETAQPRIDWYHPCVDNPLRVIDELGRVLVTIDRPFDTDGATIPRVFWWIPGLAPFDWRKAAILHDWLWECRKSGRLQSNFATSNRLLRQAIVALGWSRPLAWIVWFFVTTCGWWWWLSGEGTLAKAEANGATVVDAHYKHSPYASDNGPPGSVPW